MGIEIDALTGTLILRLWGPLETPVPFGAPTPDLPKQATLLGSVSDRALRGDNTDYALARNDPNAFAESAETSAATLGQGFITISGPTTTYLCYEYVVAFDTSVIGNVVTLTGATLDVAFQGDQSETDFVIEVRAVPANDPITSADWVIGDDLSGLPLVAQYDTAQGVAIGQYRRFDDVDLAANIVQDGPTMFLFSSSRQRTGETPTTGESVTVRTSDAASLQPRLTVTWS